MATPPSTYELLLLQFAAESHLEQLNPALLNDPEILEQNLRGGYNHPEYIDQLEEDGELSAIRMTPLMISDFTSK